MAERDVLHVFTYDISADTTRNRVAAALEDIGVRVQRSVFEAHLSRKAARFLAERLSIHLEAGDSLRVYVIGRDALPETIAYGGAPRPELQEFWLL